MDTPYLREYTEDRELNAWFLLDLSPSVDFGTAESDRQKRTVLVDFVTTLARLLTRRGNRVGAVLYGDRVERIIPAGSGRIQVLRLVEAMLKQPRHDGAPFTDLRPLLDAGSRAIKRRSLIFVISDFISEPGWERSLDLLVRRHEVIAIRLVDPREGTLPDVGPVILEDSETGEQIYLDTGDGAFRRRFEEAALAREATISAAFRRAGVEATTLSTDEDLVRSILASRAVDRRHRRKVAAFGAAGAIGPAAPVRHGTSLRRAVPAVLLLLGLGVMVLALARPQGRIDVPRQEGTVILAFDISGSMAATDLQPTRMAAAIAAATDFVHEQPASVLVGVVAFSDSGIAVQQPSNDQDAVIAAIGRLQPQRGTSLARGIEASLAAIDRAAAGPTVDFYSNRSPEPTPSRAPVAPGTYGPAVVVLLTDGENTQGRDPMEAATEAADRGVRIYTVGIGSETGATLDLDGFQVHTQLDAATLRAIADRTGATYYGAEDADTLRAVYDQIDTTLVLRPEDIELTAIFAAVATGLLLAGAIISLAWSGRLP